MGLKLALGDSYIATQRPLQEPPTPEKHLLEQQWSASFSHSSDQVIKPDPVGLPNRRLLENGKTEPGTLVSASCRPMRNLGTRQAYFKLVPTKAQTVNQGTDGYVTPHRLTKPSGTYFLFCKDCRLRKWPCNVSLLCPHLHSL